VLQCNAGALHDGRADDAERAAGAAAAPVRGRGARHRRAGDQGARHGARAERPGGHVARDGVRARPAGRLQRAARLRGAHRDARGESGAAAEPDELQVHRLLPRRGVRVAGAPQQRRPGHQHLVRGAAHLVAPAVHFSRLRGHQAAVARGLGPLRPG
jgi:hypothetical protein